MPKKKLLCKIVKGRIPVTLQHQNQLITTQYHSLCRELDRIQTPVTSGYCSKASPERMVTYWRKNELNWWLCLTRLNRMIFIPYTISYHYNCCQCAKGLTPLTKQWIPPQSHTGFSWGENNSTTDWKLHLLWETIEFAGVTSWVDLNLLDWSTSLQVWQCNASHSISPNLTLIHKNHVGNKLQAKTGR